MRTFYKKFIIFSVFIFIFIIYFLYFNKYISVEYLNQHKLFLKDFINNYYTFSILVYITLLSFLLSFSLPGVLFVFCIAGGFLYGTLISMFCVLFSLSVGGSITFFLIRYFFNGAVFFVEEKRVSKLKKELIQNSTFYLLIVRMLPIVPYFVINLTAPLLPISFFTYFWTLVVGSIPEVFLYVYSGKFIDIITSEKDIFTFEVIIFFIVLLLFLLGSFFFKKYIEHKKGV